MSWICLFPSLNWFSAVSALLFVWVFNSSSSFSLHSLSPYLGCFILALLTSASGFIGPLDALEKANQKLPPAAISWREVHMARLLSVASKYPALRPTGAPYTTGPICTTFSSIWTGSLLGDPVSTSSYFLGEGSWVGPLEPPRYPQIMLWGAVIFALQTTPNSALDFHCLPGKKNHVNVVWWVHRR